MRFLLYDAPTEDGLAEPFVVPLACVAEPFAVPLVTGLEAGWNPIV